MEWMERTLLRWLAAVAPRGWCESMLGDLREDTMHAGRPRWWTLCQLAALACRFTIESAWQRLTHPRADGFTLLREVRFALRALLRTPAFFVVTVVTLALAIGATTAIYSALRSLVLDPLPFKDGDRFVFIWHRSPEMGSILVTPPTQAIDRWRGATATFESIESFTGKTFLVTDNGEPEEVSASLVRPSTFATFGVRPQLGRAFVDADLDAAAPPVALISHGLWTRRFRSNPAIAGTTIALSGTAYAIVGVMPPRFELPMGSSTLWIPARADLAADSSQNVIAKLRRGVSVDDAQRALDAMSATATGDDLKGWFGQIMALGDRNGSAIKTALFVLSGAVGLLLALACVNIANLLLARHRGRRREVAVRQALGASRGHLLRHLLVESAILAGAGGAGGLLVANAMVAGMVALRPRNLDLLDRVAIDSASFGFAAAVSVVTALLFGLGPAIVGSRGHLHDVLTSSGRTATASGQRLRLILTVAQVAIALILVVGASLLLRSYAHLSAVNPGFDPEGIVSIKVSLPNDRYPAKDKARRHAFFEDLAASVRALPGVASVAVGNGVPPDSGVMFGTLEISGRAASTPPAAGLFSGGYVTPSYFSTLRIPLVEGRAFGEDDVAGRDQVAIVGRTLAAQYWHGQSPIGSQVRIQSVNGWATVVGVVADVKAIGLAEDSGRLQLYFPRAQVQPGFGSIIVRASGDPIALIPAIKARLWAIDPKLPIRDIATADQLKSRATSQSRFNVALLLAFAGCGLALAVVGVYGVIAIFVGQRQRELGIRMALGATTAAIGRLVLRQTGLVLALGIAIGTGGAALLSHFVRKLLFDTAPTDAGSYALAVTAIALAALVATLVPLRRATTVDPTIVLRGE